jgi:hypothetical protein
VGPTCQPTEEKKGSGPAESGRGEKKWASGPAEKKKNKKKKEGEGEKVGRGEGWATLGGPKENREREGEKGVVKDFSFFSKPF